MSVGVETISLGCWLEQLGGRYKYCWDGEHWIRTKFGEEESSSFDKVEMLVGVTSGEDQLGVWMWRVGACE